MSPFLQISASETLGWTAVSQTIGALLGYLPALLSAVIIAIVGLYIAHVVKNLILTTLHSLEMHSAKIISNFTFLHHCCLCDNYRFGSGRSGYYHHYF